MLKNKITYSIEGEPDFNQFNYNDSELGGGTKTQFYLVGTYNESNRFYTTFTLNTDKYKYKWSSSNEKKAKVTSKGVVYTLRKGTVTITAKGNGITVKKKININGENHVTYKTNGGTLHPLSARDFDTYFYLRPAEKEGYLFKGWYYDKDYTYKYIPENDWYIGGDETVYAKWWKVKVKKAKTPKLKITNTTKRLLVRIPKVDKADGYQVYYSTNKNFKDVKKVLVEKNSYVSPKVEKGKTYYVKVRAFRYDSTGKRVYGKFSNVNKIKA